jgi:hypothetical protein
LKIGDGDSQRAKNDFAQKNKTDRNAKAGEDSEKSLMFPVFRRTTCAKSQEERDQSDRIDGDEDGNEGEQKFLNHAVIARFGFTGKSFYTIIPCSINETFPYENFSLVDLTSLSCS